MKIYILNIYFIISVGFIFFSCGNSERESDEKANNVLRKDEVIQVSLQQFENSEMKLGKIQEKEFPLSVEATGIIDVPPENKAVINSYTSGYVKETKLLIGDKVKKGQFLVSLENPDYIQMQQDYLDAMEQMKYLKSEYDRQEKLMAENITSEKNFLKAESDYKRNRSRYSALRKKLQMLNLDPEAVENGAISSVIRIYAPISGNITELNIKNGMYVTASTALMQIVDRDHVHIELDVFEKDVMKIKKGQEIRFLIPEAQSDTIKGIVHLVGNSISDQKRTVKVHGHFMDNEDQKDLATGMFVQAYVITKSKKEKALPEISIVSLEEDDYVLVLEGKNDSGFSFRREKVTVGDSFDGFTVIKNSSDFNENDQFLTKGSFPLITE
ncbi:efflux RND transporter periplasmic adaptor subunit [Gramella lutea]|uniref:Efflux RND transporter periplasmic adaptor subunit n=1 Tax=Christiangramia lutea TaxID=1607951 RepID=A0A9X2AAD0_9FLAO|nr:efflux RND transporter periplasmic adaptor subunit [Christiangramia lutea]MCH4824365.1 efflux RND transporter periplasmic adaptor subunit [Christiangramia lutea]